MEHTSNDVVCLLTELRSLQETVHSSGVTHSESANTRSAWIERATEASLSTGYMFRTNVDAF